MLKKIFSWCKKNRVLKQISVFYSATLVSLNFWIEPAIGDPFRQINPIEIGEKTVAAFQAMFEKGNYKKIKESFKSPITWKKQFQNKNLCPGVAGRYFKNVKNIESPKWLQDRLTAI